MKIVTPDTGWFSAPFYTMTFRKVDPQLRGAITPPLSPEYSKVESTAKPLPWGRGLRLRERISTFGDRFLFLVSHLSLEHFLAKSYLEYAAKPHSD